MSIKRAPGTAKNHLVDINEGRNVTFTENR